MPLYVRLDQPHHRVGRDRRVDGIAAALEHLHAGARGQRLARRDDAVFRRDLRPPDDDEGSGARPVGAAFRWPMTGAGQGADEGD